MRKWIGMLCAAVLLAVAAAEGSELRVMTYNIHHGRGMDDKVDLPRIAKIAIDAGADVVCLQEVDKGLSRTEREDFPERFKELLSMDGIYGPNYLFDDGEYGNATFSRFPIVDHENHALPGPEGAEPRGALRVTIEVDGAEIDVWNTHWGLSPAERAAQGEAMAAMLRDKPTIAVGDYNENETGAGLKAMLAELDDAAAAVGEENTPTVPSTVPRRRIDLILVSDEFTVKEFAVVGGPLAKIASDHRPVESLLEFTPRPETENDE